MKHDELEHIKYMSTYLEQHWPYVVGVTTTLWYALIRMKKSIFRQYVTLDELHDCKREICSLIEEEGQRNADQHDRIMTTIIEHLDKR